MAYDESLMSSRGNYCFLYENKQSTQLLKFLQCLMFLFKNGGDLFYFKMFLFSLTAVLGTQWSLVILAKLKS